MRCQSLLMLLMLEEQGALWAETLLKKVIMERGRWLLKATFINCNCSCAGPAWVG